MSVSYTHLYIGLLDHDDILTRDALYEMACALEKQEQNGIHPVFLYSDEDKCDGEAQNTYEPHRKTDFNLDLLLSNNYICHFLVMDAAVMKRLRLRTGFDGAQDYDLVLRAAGQVLEGTPEEAYVHIPKILYHWRCHRNSTASNPASKTYALSLIHILCMSPWNLIFPPCATKAWGWRAANM